MCGLRKNVRERKFGEADNRKVRRMNGREQWQHGQKM